ncbi:hypothetical protein JANET_213 [Bacillus phage Janet]|nr:hypothetical protein JANET_213 [Bacillus phage Janet]
MNKEANLIKVPVTITEEYVKVTEAMAELQAKAHELGESLDEIYGVEEGRKRTDFGGTIPYLLCVRLTGKSLSQIEKEIDESIEMNKALGYGFDEKFYFTNKWVEEKGLFV